MRILCCKNVEMSLQRNCDAPSFSDCGQDSEGTIKWVHNPFPNDMDDILFDSLFDEDDYKFGHKQDESNDDCQKHTQENLKWFFFKTLCLILKYLHFFVFN